MSYPFIKMDGIGNDFVILDGRKKRITLSPEQVQKVAARDTGVGCDQLIVMEPSEHADVFMRIYNADGGEVASCGNATRCVAWLIMQESGKDGVTIETVAGVLACRRAGDKKVCVDMGKASFNWQDIPLAEERDTLHLDITEGDLKDPAAVSMGNPHMVFAVPNAIAISLDKIGPKLEHHALFPERANVSFAEVKSPDAITLRVWERGAGATLACGTAACASVAALNKRGQVGKDVMVTLPGGMLHISIASNGHVMMTGEVAENFRGELEA